MQFYTLILCTSFLANAGFANEFPREACLLTETIVDKPTDDLNAEPFPRAA
jgi:hypothetical protein